MKKVFSHSWTALVSCAITLFLFSSCENSINRDYDLTKEIDMTINLLQGFEAPVGSVSAVSITDLLEMDVADTELIIADEKGNLSIQYGGDEHFNIDNIDFGSWARQAFAPVRIDFPLSRFNLSGFQLPGTILSYSELIGDPFYASLSTCFESEIPKEIIDVEYVDFHEEISLNFSTIPMPAYIKAGLRIKFPEYVSIQNYYEHPEFIVENDNTIVLVQDVKTPADLTFFLNRVHLPEGALKDGRIEMDLGLELEGDVYVNTDEFTDLSKDLEIVVSSDEFLFKPKSASVKIDAEFEPTGTEIEIPELPDFFTDDNICLDLCDPTLFLTVKNWTDLQFELQAEGTAHQSSLSPSVSLGTDPQILIKRQSDNKYLISTTAADVEDGIVNIVRPVIRDMFKEIPEKISIDGMKLKLADEYAHFNLGVSYQVQYEYLLNLPLTFGEELNIQYTFDVNTYDVDLEAGVSNSILNLELVNSLPITFDLDVQALDSEDNPIEWIEFDLDAKIASGTQDSPTVSPVVLTFKSHKEQISFAGLRFKVSATAASADHLGVSLNKNQGIELRNLTLSVPDGITINPENF